VFLRELGARIEGTAISNISLFDVRSGTAVDQADVGAADPLLVPGFGAAERTRLAEIAGSTRLELVKIGDVGGRHVVGFAAGGGDGRYAVYAESVVPQLEKLFVFRLPSAAEYALFIGSEPTAETVLTASTDRLPLIGRTATEQVRLGNETATLVVGSTGGLASGLSRAAPWLALLLGSLVTLAIALLVEITRRRSEAEIERRTLTEQNARLRELDRLKDELVAVVSHELRTPLTSILGYLELVRDDATELSDEHRGFLEVVDRNARRLLSLVGDLLFVARIDAGGLELELNDVDVASLAAECVEGQAPHAESAGVALDLATGPLGTVRGDRARIAQLLDNLVSNAVKFTNAGGAVNVGVREEGGVAVIEVADTGIGIPAAEQGRLFERFFRSSTATADAVQGTGLGLTIAKAIVDAHGGTITATSEEGVGTTFRVELPLAPLRASAPVADSVLVR
jgi:signal transduction histidine kinase